MTLTFEAAHGYLSFRFERYELLIQREVVPCRLGFKRLGKGDYALDLPLVSVMFSRN
jgi:hypothetical protein